MNARGLIRKLNRIDVNQVDFSEIVSIFRPATGEITVSVGLSSSVEMYFRARICNSIKPMTVSELGAPPAELVTGFQRCNQPGKPMFYGSSKRITALFECNVREGDTVYLGQWINSKPVPINRLLSLDSEDEIRHFTRNEQVINTYIDTIFTRPVHETFSNVYKITAAVTELLTTDFTPNVEDDIRKDGTVGFVYPSVHDATNSYNTVFHSSFAAERLQLVHVMAINILKRDIKKISISVIDNAVEFPNGEILWLNDERAVPKLREDRNKQSFISNGRAWLLPVCDRKQTTEQLDALLDE